MLWSLINIRMGTDRRRSTSLRTNQRASPSWRSWRPIPDLGMRCPVRIVKTSRFQDFWRFISHLAARRQHCQNLEPRHLRTITSSGIFQLHINSVNYEFLHILMRDCILWMYVYVNQWMCIFSTTEIGEKSFRGEAMGKKKITLECWEALFWRNQNRMEFEQGWFLFLAGMWKESFPPFWS